MFLALSCLFSFWASGQNLISPITINLPANPPANTAEWATTMPPVMILAQTNLVNGQVNGAVQESKILVYITKAGTKVCGTYTPQTAPMAGFNTSTKNWSGANVLSLLGQDCTLQPGSYELCVQFYGYNGSVAGAKLLGEKCKAFTIVDKKQGAESYSPPQNVMPADGKILSDSETKVPMNFRWTPVIPRPKDNVVYKVIVFEIRKGETATQSRKSNGPLMEKEVTNQTQLSCCINPIVVWPIAADSKYGWYVQATDNQGKSLGNSTPTTFAVNSFTCDPNLSIKATDSVCLGTVNGMNKYHICFDAKYSSANIDLTYADAASGIKAYLPISPFTNYTISAVTTLTSQLHGTGVTTKNYCFDVLVPPSITMIRIGLQGDDKNPDPVLECKPAASFDIMLPSCRCNLCDTNVVKWTLPTLINYSYSLTNNTVTLGGPISFGPYPIVKLSTEIVDFYWYTEGDCKKCNNNDFYFGNLISGNLTSMLGGTSVAGPGGTPIPSSRQLDFISPTLSGLALNGNVNLNISLPPQTQLSCCTDCFRFCIRYTATFMQNGVCKTCSIVKCYETKRVHKQTEYGLQINQCGERIVKDLPNGELLEK